MDPLQVKEDSPVRRLMKSKKQEDCDRYTVPFENGKCVKCNRLFVKAGGTDGLTRHYETSHCKTALEWACDKCGSTNYITYNACVRHYVRCKGPVEENLPFKCKKCARSFERQVGLSLHMRQKHPRVAAEVKVGISASEKAGSSQPQVWSDEELEKLDQLMRKYEGTKHYCATISAELGTKTAKQVSDRARIWRNKVRLRKKSAETEATSDRSESSSAEAETTPRTTRPSTRGNPCRVGDDGSCPSSDSEPKKRKLVRKYFTESDESTEETEEHVSDDSSYRPPTPPPPQPPDSPPHGPPEPEPEGARREEDCAWKKQLARLALQERIERTWPVNEIAIRLDQALQTYLDVGEVDWSADQDIEDLNIIVGAAEATRPRLPRGRGRRWNNKKSRRYARTQQLYFKNRTKLADMVVENNLDLLEDEGDRVLPPIQEVKDLYNELWNRPVQGKLEYPLKRATALEIACPPFTSSNIRKRFSRIKNGTAPGRDGISKTKALQTKGICEILSKVYTLILVSAKFPKLWLHNRTVLIPKPDKNRLLAESWRPITIGCLFSRVLSGLLDERLRRFVELSTSQRGFTVGNGCKTNCFILHEALRNARSGKQRGMVAVQIDFAKAFDTVPHNSIELAMKSQGVPQDLVQLITSSYSGATTQVRVGENAFDVEIHRGVKQGDPLSPLLFNMVINPLLESLEGHKMGELAGTTGAVAFADDLTLLSEEPRVAQQQVSATEAFVRGLGMSLQPNKCFAGFVKYTNKKYSVENPELKLEGNTPLRALQIDEDFRFLGATFTLQKGVTCEGQFNKIFEVAERASRLALKPRQKLCLMFQYIIPKFTHSIMMGNPAQTELEKLDTRLRVLVRRVLHLHPTTTDGIIDARRSDGGLGLPKLTNMFKIAGFKALLGVNSTHDDRVQHYAMLCNLEERLRTIAGKLEVEWPPTPAMLEKAKYRLKRAEWERWANLRSAGRGVRDFDHDPVGNAWLSDDRLLWPSRFVNALKLRTITLGTRVVCRRADPNIDEKCRRCGVEVETLGHVLGKCVVNKPLIIRRHDEIKNFVIAKLEEAHYTVAVEQTFAVDLQNAQQERLKPDIVAAKNGKLAIIDVTVRFEDGDALEQAVREKEVKYIPLLPRVRDLFKCNEGRIVPLVFGSRGAFPKRTEEQLKSLGIYDVSIGVTTSMIALRNSLNIALLHLDGLATLAVARKPSTSLTRRKRFD